MANYPYDELDTNIDRAFVAGLNKNFDDVEQDLNGIIKPLQAVIEETTNRDIISAPEIIAARDGKNNLGERLNQDHLEVTAQLAQTELELSSRMDTFTALPNGSTSGDAELIDGRIGSYGKTYANIGTSIRSQVSDTKEQTDIALANGLTKVATNKALFESGGINSTGSNISDSRYIRTKDFVSSDVVSVRIVGNSALRIMVIHYDKTTGVVSRTQGLTQYLFGHQKSTYKLVIMNVDNVSQVPLDFYQSVILYLADSTLGKVIPELSTAEKLIDGVITPSNTSFIKQGKNMINPETATADHYVEFGGGGLIPDPVYMATDFEEIKPGQRIVTNQHYAVAFYKPDFSYAAGINSSGTDSKNYTLVPGEIQGAGKTAVYTAPLNARWMRQTVLRGSIGQVQTEVGEVPTAYEPYTVKIDGLRYVPAWDDSSPTNSLVKEGDVVTITMGKAQYKMVRQSNSGRALNTWRLYQGDIVKDGSIYHRMWVDSDAEGAIKEVGAADFIGGFHGDETYTKATFLVNGKPLDLSGNYILEFKTLDIFVESKLYHCDTTVEAFDRVKHLHFEGDTYTVTNKYTTLSPFTVNTAALALFNCYKEYEGKVRITHFSDNYRVAVQQVPQKTSVDAGLYNSTKLDEGVIYGDGFLIKIKYLDDKLPEYGGIWTDFGTQGRMKLYLHTIASTRALSVGEVLTSKFSVTII